MLVFKAVDSFEDVYQGNYQQHGRLDVGAELMTVRLVATITLFAELVVAMRTLLVPLAIATAFAIVLFVCQVLWARRRFGLPLGVHSDDGHGPGVCFSKRFALQSLIIVGITLVCIAGAWLFGIPVLGWLYNADLAPYKLDLIILLVGGRFLALVTLFTTGITIIRWQWHLTVGYVVVAILSAITSPMAVQAAGVDGASMIYCIIMLVLTVWFGIVFAVGIRKGSPDVA
jgi:hypothetical protein